MVILLLNFFLFLNFRSNFTKKNYIFRNAEIRMEFRDLPRIRNLPFGWRHTNSRTDDVMGWLTSHLSWWMPNLLSEWRTKWSQSNHEVRMRDRKVVLQMICIQYTCVFCSYFLFYYLYSFKNVISFDISPAQLMGRELNLDSNPARVQILIHQARILILKVHI